MHPSQVLTAYRYGFRFDVAKTGAVRKFKQDIAQHGVTATAVTCWGERGQMGALCPGGGHGNDCGSVLASREAGRFGKEAMELNNCAGKAELRASGAVFFKHDLALERERLHRMRLTLTPDFSNK